MVCEHLLEGFRLAEIDRALVVLRSGKWDIPAFLGDGSPWGLDLAYRVIESSSCVPETLAAALPFAQEANIALGFPDILFEPHHAFRPMLRHLAEASAEVVLAAVPSDRPDKADMVELANDGRVRDIVIKRPGCTLRHAWTLAVWSPRFSAFLLDFVEERRSRPEHRDPEPHVGDVLRAAIAAGRRVDALVFDDGSFLDIGTPDDLARARGPR